VGGQAGRQDRTDRQTDRHTDGQEVQPKTITSLVEVANC
jgi:hypothetical protein